MAYAMGMAGSRGMLRRTFYEGTTYQPYTLVAIIGGSLVALGFLAFLANLVGTLGLRNVLGIILPERWLGGQQAAPAQA
jgi:heme/copper-type cytochrome/quinol oxidase subunit 1